MVAAARYYDEVAARVLGWVAQLLDLVALVVAGGVMTL